MSDSLERAPSRLPWPPILFISAIAGGILLNYFWPLPWLGSPISDILFAAGWLLAAGAVALHISSIRTMHRARTTVDPTKPADHQVISGPFSFSRNPIYLGGTVLVIAIGLISGSVWFPVTALVAAFATQKLAIEPEERHLSLRFGKRYRDYQKKVRRWI
jgi:protein-S-isoprenylcysteine O-methyltransferase Ste14